MNLYFHPGAEEEFLAAVSYYENIEPGLGDDFALEVFATIRNIVSYPNAWPSLEEDVRRCLVNRFPFGVLYSIEPEFIYILAVMHLHRDPEYWKDRR